MNVVLDTNILVGGAITPRGPAGHILAAWRDQAFTLIVSSTLLDEAAQAFAYPRVRRYLAWSDSEVTEFLVLLRTTALLIEPDLAIDAVGDDADDNRVLEAAVVGEAEYIVTNDDDLLRLGSYGGIRIVTAARFAAIPVPIA